MNPLFACLMLVPISYMDPVIDELAKKWPGNRTVNIVCHGHSVPAGYFETPVVDSLNAYPQLLLKGIKARFPYAPVNVIVTAIGGENSVSGAKRFAAEVLSMRPDVVLIDYGLNDRGLPAKESREAWTSMVRQAKGKGIKVLLLTPTGDTGANMDDPNDPLSRQATQIREIAAAESVGLVDSYEAFRRFVHQGGDLSEVMSQSNHPNRRGHELVAAEILKWFPEATR